MFNGKRLKKLEAEVFGGKAEAWYALDRPGLRKRIDNLYSYISKVEENLNHLYNYLGVHLCTDSAKTYVAKVKKR